MEIFYYEEPTLSRKDEAIEFIREFYEFNSNINGSGGLHRYLDNYEKWLRKLDDDYIKEPDERRVPSLTHFLIRESDNKIVGMSNIRLMLNEILIKSGGHIGYSIRPTERRKGYNKINLYLALQVLDKYGVEEALLDADLDNPASWRTMEALGGIRIAEYIDEYDGSESVKYAIDVSESLKKYQKIYEPYVHTH